MAKKKSSGVAKSAEARREVIDLLDRLTEPSQMSKQEALDTLEELSADLEGRVEALKNEIRDET